jgi:ribosome-binding factor A
MSTNVPTQRQLRVGELIRHELAGVFARGETGDPALERMGVTVLEVAVSPDLRIATAYVRPFAQGTGEELLSAIERNRRYIRGLISPRLRMKFMPELRFRLDNALDYAAHVDELLQAPTVRRDLEKNQKGG